MICLYVLKLEENKYYVGITRDLDERLSCHKDGEGARWTALYPPVKQHLDYYLDEYTFRFNRRKSRSRGKLFYRLLQQAVQVDPAPYKAVVGGKHSEPGNHNI